MGLWPTLLQLSELFFTLPVVLGCALLGALAGFLGGMLGIGGGVIMVPGLLLLFDQLGLFPDSATLVALGTSLTVIVFTSLSAARAQVRAGKVRWPIVRHWTLSLVLGALAASWIAVLLPAAMLRGLIALFLFAVAWIMLTGWKPDPARSLPGGAGSAVLGGCAGVISGLAGIGGGNVIVPTLVYHNVPMHNATATSSTLGVPVALSAAAGYALLGPVTSSQVGYVFLPAAGIMLVAAVLFAPLGVRLAHHTDAQRLKRYFGGLLVVVACRMLYTAVS